MTHAISGPKWIPRFLATLAATKRVGKAIEAAGVTSNAIYAQRRRNRLFADAWRAALAEEMPAAAQSADTPPQPLPARNAGWRVPFIEALAETSNVAASARHANVPVETVYKTRRKERAFAARWLAALSEGYDNLEMELLGHLRDPAPERKMDVTAALRLLAAHRETVERRRALDDEEDEQAVLESIDRFIDEMRVRRAANNAILIEARTDDDTE